MHIPYARHYKPWLIFFFTKFSLQLRLILQTIYVLKREILHFLSSKSAAYKRERLQIKSSLWWRAYGTCTFKFFSQEMVLSLPRRSPSFNIKVQQSQICHSRAIKYKKHDTITNIGFGSFTKKCSKLLVKVIAISHD